jgi:hypothetical protein
MTMSDTQWVVDKFLEDHPNQAFYRAALNDIASLESGGRSWRRPASNPRNGQRGKACHDGTCFRPSMTCATAAATTC